MDTDVRETTPVARVPTPPVAAGEEDEANVPTSQAEATAAPPLQRDASLLVSVDDDELLEVCRSLYTFFLLYFS